MNPDISKILIHELSTNALSSIFVVDLHPFLTVNDEDLILGYARSVRPVQAKFVFGAGAHSVIVTRNCLLTYVPSKTGHSRWQLNCDQDGDWALLNESDYPKYGEFLKFLKQYSSMYLSLYNPKYIEQLDLALTTLQAESFGVSVNGSTSEISDRCVQKINKDFEKFFEA